MAFNWTFKRVLVGVVGMVWLLVIAGSTGPAVKAGAGASLSLVDQVGGEMNAIALQEPYAYVGHGARLVAFDTSDPTSLTTVWTSQPYRDRVHEVVLSDNRAYVAVGAAGLYVYDISQPDVPVRRAHYSIPEQRAVEISLLENGGLVLRTIATDSMGPWMQTPVQSTLWLLLMSGTDAGSSLTPIAAPGNPLCSRAEGQQLFVMLSLDDTGDELVVYDMEAPGQPQIIGRSGRQETFRAGFNCEIRIGRRVHVLSRRASGVGVFDTRNHNDPEYLGRVGRATESGSIRVVGDHLFVGAMNSIAVYDTSGQINPLDDPLGGLAYFNQEERKLGWVHDLAVTTDGDRLYAVFGNHWFYQSGGSLILTFDVSDLTAIERVGTFEGAAAPVAVGVEDSSVFLLDARGVVHAYRERTNGLELRSSLQVYQHATFWHGGAKALAAVDGFVFVAQLEPGLLHVIDYRDLDQPRYVDNASNKLDEVIRRIAVSDNYLLLETAHGEGNRLRGFIVMDMSDPATPQRVESSLSGLLPLGTPVTDERFFLQAGPGAGAGMLFATSELPDPSRIVIPGTPWASSVALTSSHAYLGHDEWQLEDLVVADYANRSASPSVRSTDIEVAGDIVVSGNRLFSVAETDLLMLDITNPEAPRIKATTPIPVTVDDTWIPPTLAVTASHLFLVDSSAGLLVYDPETLVEERIKVFLPLTPGGA